MNPVALYGVECSFSLNLFSLSFRDSAAEWPVRSAIKNAAQGRHFSWSMVTLSFR
jgi:hypothetical protein